MDPKSFWEMQPREFTDAWIGYEDHRRQGYSVLFDIIKMHGQHTTTSKSQADSLQKIKNPFTNRPATSGKPMTMGQVLSMFPQKKRKK